MLSVSFVGQDGINVLALPLVASARGARHNWILCELHPIAPTELTEMAKTSWRKPDQTRWQLSLSVY